ncbi:hypothetical protein LTR53_019811, partial [Teratosphaeriaceae sp. CCFEE 6253]
PEPVRRRRRLTRATNTHALRSQDPVLQPHGGPLPLQQRARRAYAHRHRHQRLASRHQEGPRIRPVGLTVQARHRRHRQRGPAGRRGCSRRRRPHRAADGAPQ